MSRFWEIPERFRKLVVRRGLGISVAAAPDKIQKDEAPEKEDRDQNHKPYNAQ